MGGLFHRCKTKLKRFSLGIGTILCPKLGEDQKETGLHPRWDQFLLPSTLQVQCQSRHILIANANGGLFPLLVQKSVSKVLQTWYFAYSACRCGAILPAPPGYATGQTCVSKFRNIRQRWHC